MPQVKPHDSLEANLSEPIRSEPTPFLCRRSVRLTIYLLFAVLLLGMLAWRYVPGWLDPTFEKHIASKRVMVGMDRQQVLQAWGSPYSINVSHTNDGTRREEWIYEDWESTSIVKHRYLYFEEGTLVGGWYYSSTPAPKSPPSTKFHDERALQDISR
jgi:hypothetical protein